MNRLLSTSALLVLAAVGLPSPSQEPPKNTGPKLLTPEASLNLRNISDPQFSPDGSRLAFVVTEPAKGERRARHIWIYEKQSGMLRQFTFSGKSKFYRAGRLTGNNWLSSPTVTNNNKSSPCAGMAAKPAPLPQGSAACAILHGLPTASRSPSSPPKLKRKRKIKRKKTKTTPASWTKKINIQGSGCSR